MVAIRSVATKNLMLNPPKRIRAKSIRIIVRELLSERTIVSVTALFARWEKGVVVSIFVCSRILSNTTIVSWTEKDIVVKIAVTNNVSNSASKNLLKSEYVPKTIRKSWISATIAASPYVKRENEIVRYRKIPMIATMAAMIVFCAVSFPMVGPTVS